MTEDRCSPANAVGLFALMEWVIVSDQVIEQDSGLVTVPMTLDEIDKRDRAQVEALAANNPTRYKILPSGALRDYELGMIVANPGGGAKAITTDTSLDYHRKRLELQLKTQSAARRGLARCSAKGRAKGNVFDTVADIAEAQGNMALNPELGRSSTEAGRFAMQLAGLMMDARQQLQPQMPDTGAIVALSNDAIREMAAYLGRGRPDND